MEVIQQHHDQQAEKHFNMDHITFHSHIMIAHIMIVCFSLSRWLLGLGFIHILGGQGKSWSTMYWPFYHNIELVNILKCSVAKRIRIQFWIRVCIRNLSQWTMYLTSSLICSLTDTLLFWSNQQAVLSGWCHVEKCWGIIVTHRYKTCRKSTRTFFEIQPNERVTNQ